MPLSECFQSAVCMVAAKLADDARGGQENETPETFLSCAYKTQMRLQTFV
jgi:hypothetical protein